jgi:phosphate transport system permease protein
MTNDPAPAAPADPRPADPVLPGGVGPWRYYRERAIEGLLFLAAVSSVVITGGIVYTLLSEAVLFFTDVSPLNFLGSTEWAPGFDPPRYGVLPLVAGTLVTTFVALAVALPIGTVVAIYLSEFAPTVVREVLKPVLELLSAVPTVVYGYFALLFVTPFLQGLFPGLSGLNMLSAGLVMGIMIIPYVSSLSEDAMRAVPMSLREGAYALGANKIITAVKVVVPAAFSGIGAAYILGISRAIGETMIVAIAAGLQPNLTFNPAEPAATMTAFIVAISQGDLVHGTTAYRSIFAVGLLLFLMTLLFNVLGYWLRKRFREAY